MPGKARILIVDDSARARNSLRALLAIYADETDMLEAENGWEALLRIDTSSPEVVLMDVMMPELDGITATEIIKQYAPQVKVIAVSMSPDYRSEALAAGADAFVCKGDPPGVLLEALVRLTGWPEDDSGTPPPVF
jgi:two-component system NarL family response regulator